MRYLKYFFFSIIVILLLAFVYFVTYTFAEPKAYDFMTKNVLAAKLPFDSEKNIEGHNNVVLVVVDDKTCERYRWPWKRELYNKIFNYFKEYSKPKAIVFDSIITTLDSENPESDKKYFEAVKHLDNFITGYTLFIQPWQNGISGINYDKEFASKFSIKVKNNADIPQNLYSSVSTMPKPYFDVVENAGSVTMLAGMINGQLLPYGGQDTNRNHQHIIKYKGNYYPSLALKTFLTINNISEIVLNKNFIEFPELNYKVRHYITDYQATIPIRFYQLKQMPNGMYSNYSHYYCSAIDVMDSYDNIKSGKKSIVVPEMFNDAIVVVGGNATATEGLNDNKNTPIRQPHPGVDIQATYIDNLINNDFLRVIPQWINLIITLLGMLLVYLCIRKSELTKALFYILLIVTAYIIASSACFYYAVVINVITPIVMFVITIIIAYTHKYSIEYRNKEKVKAAMGKYISEDVMKRIVQNIDNLGLGGKKSTVTVLFSDIRGFTSLSERLPAQKVSELLNEYFTEMEPIVTKYNGIINKFIGDAIMAVFGEPIQDENHATNAVMCGYEMLARVQELNKKWEEEGRPHIEIGVGVNTGEVFVGNIGSEKRMEYTVIGDTVNLASRLESYNKTYKTKMLISESTYTHAKDIASVVKIPDVEIRGKANTIDIYEVLKVKI